MMKRWTILLNVLTLIIPAILYGQIHFTANLTGAQEVPPTGVSGTGTGSFTLNGALTELKYVITYQGLTDTLTAGGHFHTAKPGVNGPVVRTIATHGGSASATILGTWKSTDASQPLTPALVESLLTGRMYVNFHTPSHGGGEIRGLVKLETDLHFESNLSGSQEPTTPITGGTGTGVFVLEASRTKMHFAVTYRGLSGPLSAAGGHIHVGPPGVAGPVVKAIAVGGWPAELTLQGDWATTDASQPLTDALVDSLIAGKLYANFHTAANPGGEIRGKLTLVTGTGFVAMLDSSQEKPTNPSTATGTGSFSLNAARTELKYNITYIGLTGPLTAGHFHAGRPGIIGGVVRTIASAGDSASSTVSGTWTSTDAQPLTPALVESLLTGRVYVNYHTSFRPGGEIRGVLNMTTGIGFTVRLDGAQETPPVATTGNGTGSVVLHADRDSISYSVTYFGLSGALSAAGGHFHTGVFGVGGPVVKAIAAGSGPASATVTSVWTSSDATQALTSDLVDSLIVGKIYTNFHTGAHPGGEIRGQLAFDGDVVTSVNQVSSRVPDAFKMEQNYPNPFNPSTTIRFELTRASKVTLKVFNVIGQEVATLLNDVREAGSHEVTFNANALSSGVYFYRLSTSTGLLDTKKMVLLK